MRLDYNDRMAGFISESLTKASYLAIVQSEWGAMMVSRYFLESSSINNMANLLVTAKI